MRNTKFIERALDLGGEARVGMCEVKSKAVDVRLSVSLLRH